MKKIFDFCKNKYALLGAALSVPFLGVLADDAPTADTKLNAAIDGWVGTAKVNMEGWTEKLTPLFTAGIIIILLIIAYRLFKRVTKTAS